MLIPDTFFEYINHIGCAISLHSITNSGLIAGGTKFKQGKTDSSLYGCESHGQRSPKDPYKLDLTEPRLASYKQKNVEKTPKHGVLGRYAACSTKRIELLSNKI